MREEKREEARLRDARFDVSHHSSPRPRRVRLELTMIVTLRWTGRETVKDEWVQAEEDHTLPLGEDE